MSNGPARPKLLASLALAFGIASPLLAQAPSGPPAAAAAVSTGSLMANSVFDLEISVRDIHGNSVDAVAVVHLTSFLKKFNATSAAQDLSPARFNKLSMGEYDVEVTCPGFRKTTEHLSLDYGYSGVPIFLYLVPESDAIASRSSAPAAVLPSKLRPDMEHAMEALRKGHYAAAQKSFTKLLPKSQDNPDILYNLGLCELALQHNDLARANFQRALVSDPNHELALVSLAQMEFRNDSPSAAIPLLEKAVASGRASWRADYDLAGAYLKVTRLIEAESEASRAVRLARNQSAAPLYLLGQIQYAAGKRSDAKSTWESVVTTFPSDPNATQAKQNLAQLDFASDTAPASATAGVAAPELPESAPNEVAEHPWAPPDIDSFVPDLAPNVSCDTNAILDSAFNRLKTQLLDFEKFTATEHIEQEEIDRYGWPGPAKSRDFSYIVLVYPLAKTSMYLDESRAGSTGTSGLDGAIVTTSLNALGVNVLQPYYRDRFNYSCEGLAQIRGLAAWQVHFAQKPDTRDGIRSWKTRRKTYDIPLKGRIWISSANFSVLRVETDLREPVKELQLTRDHLIVDYGPVDFASGAQQLWLPWAADMFTEFHGKRYHDKHSLTNYLLFAVDTTEKISKPKEEPPLQ